MKKPTTIIKSYDSLTRFIKSLEFAKNALGVNSSHKRDEDFTGTKTYEDAEKLIMNGWNEPLEDFKQAYKLNTKTGKQKRLNTSVIGFAACVPNAIQGRPDSMIYYKHTPQKTKVINLVYSPTDSANKNQQFFIENGKKILTAIRELESQNIRVNLTVTAMAVHPTKRSNKNMIALVALKKASQKMEIKKLCFPMAHPSWLRRFGFRQLETCKEYLDILSQDDLWEIKFGYGRPLEQEDIQKAIAPYIKNAVVLTARTINYMSQEEILKAIEQQIH